jgi:hypothetical protein
MKKVVLIVLGVLGILGGLALLGGGIALAAVFGTDGRFDAPRDRLDTPTHALVSEPVELEQDAPWDGDFGDVTVRLQAEPVAGEEVLLGIGSASDVDEYLRDVAIDEVDEWDYDDDAVEKQRVPGERVPGPPTEQTFWVVSASGPGEQAIEWELRSGTYRLVVMNPDGSEGVDVEARWGVEIPWIFPVGIGLLVAGGVALIVGIVLLVFGIRVRTRPSSPSPMPAWGPPPPPGSPPPPSAPWTPPPPPGG